MNDTSGFYKQNETGEWMYAPNFVYAPAYELLAEHRDTYAYPIDGWNWFDEAPQEYIDYMNLRLDN